LINTQEKEIKQEEILIGEVNVPVIREDMELYYPISFIMSKVLLKKTGQNNLQQEYSMYMNKYKINYGSSALGGTQEVNCVSEEGLKLILGNSKLGRLDIDQRKAMNVLLEHLGMETICEDSRFIKNVPVETINKYNEYIRDCITYVLKIEPDIVWQKCTKCNNYYPYHINFFRENPHPGKDYKLYTFCRNCTCNEKRGDDLIKHNQDELRIIYNKYGEDVYKLHRDHKVLDVYEHWISNYTIAMPKVINNEEDKILIVKHCYDKGMFKDYPDITAKVVHEVCKFRIDGNGLIQRITKELFGVNIRHGKEYIDDIKDARYMFNNYINKNNIVIDDIYAYKYDKLLKEANLSGFSRRNGNNMLGYIMELYDNKYPAYKFNTSGGDKYWGIKENRIRALKYFIEEDMKIELDKVPLYITLTALRNKGTTTMYSVCKKYYKSLFEWVNEIYPDRFDPKDFDIHYVRNDFDSIEEAEVHDILSKEFKHKVIYNPNNTDRTIKIGGKVPDWFVFGIDKCYVVEYFGLNLDRNTSHNSRIEDYKERTEGKIEIYEQLDGYGKVFIFPDDLKDNFSGLMEKIKLIH